MTGFSDYAHYDALGLAELVKKGEVTPTQLLEEAIKRRNQVNPQINAVIRPMDDLAYQAIENGLPQGAFAGAPESAIIKMGLNDSTLPGSPPAPSSFIISFETCSVT